MIQQPFDSSARPSSPRTLHFLVAALVFTFVAAYGSLVPLDYQPVPFQDAVERFEAMSFRDISVHDRVDFASNVLLYVPIGFCWLASATLDRFGVRRLIWTPLICIFCFALSVSLEFSQTWFPPRVFSQNDIAAQSIGGVLGSLLWLGIGQRATRWLRTYSGPAQRSHQLDWLLQAYALGLALYSLLPLNVTIHPGEIYNKFRRGRVVLVPFEDGAPNLETAWQWLTYAALFVPLGMLAARIGNAQRGRLRSVWESTILGAIGVVALEIAQLFVYSRFTKTIDVITGTLGVYLGALLMHRWHALRTNAGAAETGSRSGFLKLVFAALLYSAFLCAWFWWPMQPDSDARVVKEYAEGILRVPFASMYRGSEFNAAQEIFKKTVLFAPLGMLVASMIFVRPRSPKAQRALGFLGLAAFLLLGTFIELMQAIYRPHIPDITDVMLYTFGATLGMAVGFRWFRSSPGRE